MEHLRGLLHESINGVKSQSLISREIEEFLKNTPRADEYLNAICLDEHGEGRLVRSLAVLLLKNRIKSGAVEAACLYSEAWLEDSAVMGAVLVASAAQSDELRREIVLKIVSFYGDSLLLLQICEDCGLAMSSREVKQVLQWVLARTDASMAWKIKILSQFTPSQLESFLPLPSLLPNLALNPGVDEESHELIAQLLITLVKQVVDDKWLPFSYWLPYYLKYPTQSHALLELLSEAFLECGEDEVFFNQVCFRDAEGFGEFVGCLMDRCGFDDVYDQEELCRALEDLSVPDGKDKSMAHYNQGEEGEASDSDGDEVDALDSIRNCSLAILQVLTLCCEKDELSEVLLPAIFSRAESNNWLVREAAFMALAQCLELSDCVRFGGHIPNLLHFATANAQSHPHPLVRAAACKCLSVFAEWIKSFNASFPAKSPLEQVKGVFLSALGDANKSVQAAACIGIVQFMPFAGFEPASLLPSTFLALKCYQSRNRGLLYDLIGKYVSVNSDSQYWSDIVQCLLDAFDTRAVIDGTIFPLIGALIALQEANLLPPALVLPKACALAVNSLEKPDYCEDYLTAALDLIDAVVEAKALNSSALIPTILGILKDTFALSIPSTLQSAFALFGDLTTIQVDLHVPDEYWHCLKANLIPSSLSKEQHPIVPLSTASNAVWSFGMFCQNATASSVNVNTVSAIQEHLIHILRAHPRIPLGSKVYFDNLVVALGRSVRLNRPPGLESGRLRKMLCSLEDDHERQSALEYL